MSRYVRIFEVKNSLAWCERVARRLTSPKRLNLAISQILVSISRNNEPTSGEPARWIETKDIKQKHRQKHLLFQSNIPHCDIESPNNNSRLCSNSTYP